MNSFVYLSLRVMGVLNILNGIFGITCTNEVLHDEKKGYNYFIGR